MKILSACPWLPAAFPDEVAAVVPAAELVQAAPADPGFAEAWSSAEVFLGWPAGLDHAAAERMRWVQTQSAGAGKLAHAVPEAWTVTTAAGVYGGPIAEHTLAMMLHFSRRIDGAVEAMREARWGLGGPAIHELAGRRLLLLGLGDLGRCLATRAAALGMEVVGVRRHADRPPPAGVHRVEPVGRLDRCLAEADVLVATLPGTAHTRGLLNAQRIGRLRPHAGLVNVGRGSLLDHEALADALDAGRLGWAAIDVAPEEPLPPGHRLWSTPRLLITPHVGGRGEGNGRRLADLFLHNLKRYAAGDVAGMRNVFDHRWGY
ncbi:D-2-hydroxyacid dehydrogenase [Phycisphaera mikurensis]|uniref:Putative oxidoreductase n=1 Tax=Phycisphaera mikurensis (strain NBRC 102666 / KCTC 22515 / FYK2301M01) TaxID=1142394 RepID=I0IFE4_PHYMF|nr:D-2-hydroxyacid dehydrogenase [Phycisphaera mikurensis]MBB6440625.1 phosphoglycerate dehydrogenase-like enzyme [Phycisphaera mikurensis]BAM03982.1 putative oxidoreductase [Phycisphaera mikurensis NBRC 102666]